MVSLVMAIGLVLTIWLLALATVVALLAIVNKFLYTAEEANVQETLYFTPSEDD